MKPLHNYLVKWRTRADEEDTARIGPVGCGAAAITTEGENTEGNKHKQPVNTLEKRKDSVSGVAGVLRA